MLRFAEWTRALSWATLEVAGIAMGMVVDLDVSCTKTCMENDFEDEELTCWAVAPWDNHCFSLFGDDFVAHDIAAQLTHRKGKPATGTTSKEEAHAAPRTSQFINSFTPQDRHVSTGVW
jgi:hypothetical protein